MTTAGLTQRIAALARDVAALQRIAAKDPRRLVRPVPGEGRVAATALLQQKAHTLRQLEALASRERAMTLTRPGPRDGRAGRIHHNHKEVTAS